MNSGMSMSMSGRESPRGFSLIEVVITIGILMSLTLVVALMLRSGFDVKEGLSERAKMVHRLSVATSKSPSIPIVLFMATRPRSVYAALNLPCSTLFTATTTSFRFEKKLPTLDRTNWGTTKR